MDLDSMFYALLETDNPYKHMYAKFSDKNNLRSDEARRNLSVSRKRIPRILGVTLVVDGFVKIFADTTFITTSRLDGKWPYHLHNPIKNLRFPEDWNKVIGC
ncbi:hypothetical protein OUZ56_002970 [Daphnia magna]|uniref:Uncharacterized protein n=1 Tax=Daphnia magna TaxID=35525 RepID=A0ABR0A7D2_9CRUS|nr:hypothetical protein OUZ56_002970 [Daphnia magna]